MLSTRMTVLALGSLFERCSYYGMLSILVLYLNKVFHFSDSTSLALYGAYATLTFALPVAGGMVADRYIGGRQAMILGLCLLILGNGLLIWDDYRCFCLGFAAVIIGLSLYKPTCTSFFGACCLDGRASLEKSFVVFYVMMNVGGMCGAFVYGLACHYWSWQAGFAFSATSLSLYLLLFLLLFPKNSLPEPSSCAIQWPIFFSIIGCLLLASLFFYRVWFEPALLLIAVLLIIFVGKSLERSFLRSRQFMTLMLLLWFVMVFFACSLQVVSSISLFIDQGINKTVGSWVIPTPLFSALYPMAVIIMAPWFSAVWDRYPLWPVNFKISLGLFLATLAFLAFMLSSRVNPQGHAPLLWILMANVLLGAGEVCVMPAILAAVSHFSPKSCHSTMMGVLFLFIALSGYVSSFLARLSDLRGQGAPDYGHVFLSIAALAAVTSLLLCCLNPLVKKLG